MLTIRKFPKSIAGCAKWPRGTHVALLETLVSVRRPWFTDR